MSHHKRNRVGRLPRWQRLSTHIIFCICALSGLAFFLKHEYFLEIAGIQAHTYLVIHGISAAFALLACGAVIPGHMRAAWNANRNRITGVIISLVAVILMLSGLGLYYGSEEYRLLIVWTHWILGGSAFIVLPAHLMIGARAVMQTRINKTTH
jgi:cytochrome b subunit of formate dehydrogenase